MGLYSFKLPDLGEGIVESEISSWHVRIGDAVEEDQHIADVMTDKAVVEVTAPVGGRVLYLACEPGEVLAVGSELIRFEVEGNGNIAAEVAAELDAERVSDVSECHGLMNVEVSVSAQMGTDICSNSNPTPAVPIANNDIHADDPVRIAFPHRTLLTSPSLRRRARDADIDLSLVPGSGPDGRITVRDMNAYLAANVQQPSIIRDRKRSVINEVSVTGLRRVIAQKMQKSKRDIPHYSYVEEVDVTQLDELRKHLNTNRESHQNKLTVLPFIMLSLTKALLKFPQCNAHFDAANNTLKQYEAVHAGIATMTEEGLKVAVVKHCESLDLWQSASELARITQAAREGKASLDELSGSTITITSLGAIGGLATTPIINAPETSIIGVNNMQDRAVVRNGKVVVRKMMNISSSFDHRIVDGYDGAQLVQALKQYLENPAKIFMA